MALVEVFTTDDDNTPRVRRLHLIVFWILPLCRELLNSARRIRPSAPRELGVVQAWLSLCAGRTRSREERGSFMKGILTPMTEEALPSGLVRAV